jgi:hypothetical protein
VRVIAFTNDHGLREYRWSSWTGEGSPRWPWLVLLAFLLGLGLGTRLSAAEPERCVTLHVRPTILLRPGDVDVQARIAHHADHRRLRVSWDSDVGAGGSRELPLEGDSDRALVQWWNKDQPAGHYVFEARVIDAGGRVLGSDRAEIHAPEREP